MATSKVSRLLFRFSHEYLFWGAGYFDVMELKDFFQIHIVVSKSYHNNSKFRQFVSENESIFVYYEPELSGLNILQHRRYKIFCESVLEQIIPDFIIQDDYILIQNMYLFCAAKNSKGSARHVVKTQSQPSNDNTFKLIDERRVKRIQEVFYFTSLSKLLMRVGSWWLGVKSMIENYILPFSIGITNSYLRRSSYGNIDIKPVLLPFDFFFTHEAVEAAYVERLLCLPVGIVHLIKKSPRQYPLAQKKLELNSLFFAPSLIGMCGDDVIERAIWSKWADILGILMKIENIEILSIKFHPGMARDVLVLSELEQYFLQRFPHAIIHPLETRANDLISMHDIIVSDASTVLIDSRYYPSKKIISIDFLNYAGSDAMKNYDGINYFKHSFRFKDLKSTTLQLSHVSNQSPSFRDLLFNK
jgi:hypothetical protein